MDSPGGLLRGALLGGEVVVRLKSGEVLAGRLASCDRESNLLLRGARAFEGPGEPREAEELLVPAASVAAVRPSAAALRAAGAR